MKELSEFDYIFRLYYEPLYRFAHQYIADQEDCHDIVSAAYESAWRNFAHIEMETVRAYLYTTVRNAIIDLLRKREKQQRYIAYATLMSERYISNEHLAEHDDNVRLINKVLDEIGPPTSDILKACYIEEKKYKEVAEEMGVSIATVKKHMVKALRMIRELKNAKSITFNR